MGGGGTPPPNLERTRGPTSCRQNAYRDTHPQKDEPSQMSGNKVRICRKRSLVLIKSSEHKGGHIHIIYIFKIHHNIYIYTHIYIYIYEDMVYVFVYDICSVQRVACSIHPLTFRIFIAFVVMMMMIYVCV